MKDCKKIKLNIILILLILNLILTTSLIGFIAWNEKMPNFSNQQLESTCKYTLYIGTNDKDTYTQIIPTDEAKKIVNKICEKHIGNYTVTDSQGGWVDEKGNETTENTLVYSFYNVSEKEIKAIMDDAKNALNQNSILMEYEETNSLYY